MRKLKLLVYVSAALTLYANMASAGVILLDSTPGLPTNLPGAWASTVAITPQPLWQANNPVNPGDSSDTSAVWISYADTGYMGSVFQPYAGTTPVYTTGIAFTSGAGTLALDVWADDTTDVLLDNTIVFNAVFTQSICSGQPIGCQTQDAGVINLPISAGNHVLSFQVYQVGTGTDTTSNPFGLLFTGTVPDTSSDPKNVTPEPASWLLCGSALIIFGKYRSGRRRENHHGV